MQRAYFMTRRCCVRFLDSSFLQLDSCMSGADHDTTFLEHLTGHIEPVDGCRKPSEHGHLKNGLDDLIGFASDVERTVDMHLELRQGRADGSQCRHCSDLAPPLVQPRARPYVAVRERDNPFR